MFNIIINLYNTQIENENDKQYIPDFMKYIYKIFIKNDKSEADKKFLEEETNL